LATLYNAEVSIQPARVTAPDGRRTTLVYDAIGQTTRQFNVQSVTSYTYDNAGRLQQVTIFSATATSGVAYNYDAANNRIGALNAAGVRTTWSYDRTYQLVGEHKGWPNVYQTTFVYDPVGNRLVKNETGQLTTSTYGAVNQLINSRSAGGLTTYTFDAAGNEEIMREPTNTLTTNVWEYENQNTAVVKPSGARITMLYNADFRRVDEAT
jgi:YD repeat-containing protein